MYIGTQQNLGQTGVPPLISPDAPIPGGVTPPAGGAGLEGQQPTAPAAPAGPAEGAPPAEPPPMPPAQPGTIAVFAPGTEFQAGSLAPYTVPITASNLPEVSTLTLRINYDSMVLRAQTAVQGTFMNQGNVTATFLPSVNPDTGTVELVFSRPANAFGASGSGLVGSILVQAMSPGSTQISIAGSAVGPNGQPVAVQFAPATVVVR
jgi:hypothetical protein